MDSLVLIERLDELMAEAKPIPLTHEARVDRDEVYKILDRLRTTLPVEFERIRTLGKEAAQGEGLEEKLREINEALAELRRTQREQADSGGGPLTVAAAQQVREIIEAAERAAANIEREANAEAKRVREEAAAELRKAKQQAERHLAETRQRAAAEASEYLQRVEGAMTKMLERANTAGSEIDGMLQRLRGSGGSVIEELEAIMSSLDEIRVRRTTAPQSGGGAQSGAQEANPPQARPARPARRERAPSAPAGRGGPKGAPALVRPKPSAPPEAPRPMRRPRTADVQPGTRLSPYAPPGRPMDAVRPAEGAKPPGATPGGEGASAPPSDPPPEGGPEAA